ncbi:GGDEF domain-containing protein [Sulfurimonas sp.]|nr:GGDEF domain-containing protein [Sulfurimonas sp.]
MELSADYYIFIITFIKVSALSSVAYFMQKIDKNGCWSTDMKYYKAYFFVALFGTLLKALTDLFNINSALNGAISFFIVATVILLAAIEEKYRKKIIFYLLALVILSFIALSSYFKYTLHQYMYIYTVVSISLYLPMFYIAVNKGRNLHNPGYFIMSLAFLIVVIFSLVGAYSLYQNDDAEFAFSMGNAGTSSGFVLVIIGFLSKIMMTEFQKLNTLALTDTLTGMNNRRGLYHLLESIIPSSNRDKKYFSVITMDIDFFKKVNDTYGHDGGDIVLKEFSHLIKSTHRNSDISARLGGEEFVVVLPDTDKDSSIMIAEKLRQRTEELPILVNGTSVNITSSFGVDTSCSEIIDIDELMKNADKALYISKFAGRNMVVHIDDNCIDDISSFMNKKKD